MLKKILLLLVLLVAAFAIFVAMQSDDFSISRATVIAASPAEVFPHVNDFHNWEAWSPWAKLDPNSKVTFEGPASGPGAIFKWSGNEKVGEGKMTITESKPSELILLKLDFIRPFENTANTEFTFQPERNQTKVTWTMSGKHNFFEKAVCLIMNMDKEVGGDFERGLDQMKKTVEAAHKN